MLQWVGRVELLGGNGRTEGLRRGRGLRGRGSGAVREWDLRLRCRVWRGAVRAVLGEAVRGDLQVGVRGKDELLRSRAMRRGDGVVPMLWDVGGIGLFGQRGVHLGL